MPCVTEVLDWDLLDSEDAAKGGKRKDHSTCCYIYEANGRNHTANPVTLFVKRKKRYN